MNPQDTQYVEIEADRLKQFSEDLTKAGFEVKSPRHGLLRISHDLLAQLLHLPAGARIICSQSEDSFLHDRSTFRVEHEALPETRGGEPFPEIDAQISHAGAVTLWDWPDMKEKAATAIPEPMAKLLLRAAAAIDPNGVHCDLANELHQTALRLLTGEERPCLAEIAQALHSIGMGDYLEREPPKPSNVVPPHLAPEPEKTENPLDILNSPAPVEGVSPLIAAREVIATAEEIDRARWEAFHKTAPPTEEERLKRLENIMEAAPAMKVPSPKRKPGAEPGWLPDDALTREWLGHVQDYRAERAREEAAVMTRHTRCVSGPADGQILQHDSDRLIIPGSPVPGTSEHAQHLYELEGRVLQYRGPHVQTPATEAPAPPAEDAPAPIRFREFL